MGRGRGAKKIDIAASGAVKGMPVFTDIAAFLLEQWFPTDRAGQNHIFIVSENGRRKMNSSIDRRSVSGYIETGGRKK